MLYSGTCLHSAEADNKNEGRKSMREENCDYFNGRLVRHTGCMQWTGG